jgi:molybdopterin molybdotransferase
LSNLISVAEARKILTANFSAVDIEAVAISQVLGRVLAAAVDARLELPAFDNSSMDGFALRAADIQTAGLDTPILLSVCGDIPAGINPEFSVEAGQAARIVTGAVMPPGADAVIPVEDTHLKRLEPDSALPATVAVFRSIEAGAYIRPKGQDIQIGQALLPATRRLAPQDIGVLAMQGLSSVPVYRRPKIGLLSSGDELVPVGEPLTSGKIYESNSYVLQALINQNGAESLSLGTGADTFAAIKALFDQAVDSGVDLILSSAGVSMGAYDYIRTVIEQNGTLKLWRVNMRPGKPLTFGDYEGVPVIGLPGNPVSAFVGFKVFVEPVLSKLSGQDPQPPPTMPAFLSHPVESDGRESFLRAWVTREEGRFVAHLTGHQGSGNLLSLSQANALIIIPAAVKSLPAGAEVQAWYLEK